MHKSTYYKSAIWIIASIPLWIILGHSFILPITHYPFWSKGLVYSGYSATVFLALCLAARPLSRHFPGIQLFHIMNRCKREIGLASFYYALIHLGSALIKAVLKRGFFPWDMFIRPYVIPGEITLLILLALALTSSYYSQRLLGWHRWKSLHKTIYVGEACVFLHLAIQGGTRLLWAVVIFLPLLFIQRFRRSQNSSTS